MIEWHSTQKLFHSYRLEVIGRWPESEYKQTVLRGVWSALMSETKFEDHRRKAMQLGAK
jgi:hypothetical protein